MNRHPCHLLLWAVGISVACSSGSQGNRAPEPDVRLPARTTAGRARPMLQLVPRKLTPEETVHLFPENVSQSAWSGAAVLAEGRRARMLRTCFGDSVVVGITFADRVPSGGVVELKLGPEMDSPATSTEWALHPYLVTTRDSSALDLLDRIAAEAPDTVAVWVVDTTNLARSYDMQVRPVRACG